MAFIPKSNSPLRPQVDKACSKGRGTSVYLFLSLYLSCASLTIKYEPRIRMARINVAVIVPNTSIILLPSFIARERLWFNIKDFVVNLINKIA